MNAYQIDGREIYNFFIAGAYNILQWEHYLNRINVFPVPDGDTGTNLAMTMQMVISNAVMHDHVYSSLNSISETAIQNAYGNSGLIFSQYLNGFASETKTKETLDAQEFANAAIKAADYAYEAVVHPKEGTILTVMKEWAKELKDSLASFDFERALIESVKKAGEFVQQTKQKLKVFRENNVVDAGAKGFLVFLEGITSFLKHGKVQPVNQTDLREFDKHVNLITANTVDQNRYCSQFSVKDIEQLDEAKKALDKMGDSLVVANKDQQVNIHIHTDYPEDVMDYLVRVGTMVSHRIEDIKIESDMIYRRKHPIAIVTDSIADLPKNFIDENQIAIVPLRLICDSVVYTDKLTMTPELFYQKLNRYTMSPTSAQPTAADFERVLTGS